MLAETIALLYLYYYLQDVVHYRNPGQGQLILVLIATLAVIIATVAVGRVADLSGGYRRYAVLSSVVMAATGFVLAGFATWAVVIVCAFALGVGYGAFQSVSQALSMVVLPSQANAGRDLGIINIASAVPQVIGAPIAGLVVAGAGGYRGLFVFAGLLAVAAAAVFTRVPSLPRHASRETVGCALGARQQSTTRRTLSSGFLPRRRVVAQGTVLLAYPRSAGLMGHRRPGRPRRGRGGPGQRPGRLAGRAERHVLGRLGHHHRQAEHRGRDRPHRLRLGRAAGEHDPARGDPARRRQSMASASEHRTASTAARARFSGVAFDVVSPRSTPFADGRFGVRSPSR